MIAGPINLTLLIGPAVPVPAPRFLLDALQSVTVTSSAKRGQDSGFEMRFGLDKRSPLTTALVLAGGTSFPPMLRVVVVATLGGVPEVLIDGVVTNQQTTPGDGGSDAVLAVSGLDLTAVMGFVDLTGTPFPAMPPEARVALVLAKYAPLGVVPAVIPSIVSDTPSPTEQIPVQKGTDLAYIRLLAERTGYIFTLVPGPRPGTTIAYWGPDAKIGLPQPALNLDMDALTNVESMSFSLDTDSRELPQVFIQNRESKAIIPLTLPDVSPLNPPLGLVGPMPKRIRKIRESAKLSPAQAVLLGMARAALSKDFVTANGSLDVLRYGRLLRARALVGVRGAGIAYDGLYFVQRVQHQIKRGEYKQQFTLVRNGLVPTLPVVPV